MVIDIALGILLAIFLLVFGVGILGFLLYLIAMVLAGFGYVIEYVANKLADVFEPVFEPLLEIAFVLTGAKYVSNLMDWLNRYKRRET